jgi:hypothetical protein
MAALVGTGVAARVVPGSYPELGARVRCSLVVTRSAAPAAGYGVMAMSTG